MSEQFEKMTVLDLRRTAKEMGVKLGAGISKQGIIDKLTEAAAAKAEEKPAPQPAAPGHPVRSAAIITDDESEEEEDIPVLMPNLASQPVSRPVSRPVQPAPAGQSAAPQQVSGISSKAPAFTMEGSRAWHNPRAYQNPNPSYNRAPQGWGAPRSAQQGPAADSRGYNRPPQQRPDPRAQQPLRPAPYPNRFGPADQGMQENDRTADYRPAYGQQEYQSPRNEYAPRNDYAPQPRENGQGMNYARPAQNAPYYQKEAPAPGNAIPEMLAMGECGDGAGVLEVHPDGYGFLRGEHYLPGKNDVYVSNAQIRRYCLRSGDYIVGKTKPQREGDRVSPLLYITEINGQTPEETQSRPGFEEMTPVYPRKKINLMPKGESDAALRLMELLAPVGFGQRALVYCRPNADKTAFLQRLAAAIAQNHNKAQLMTILVDERPEEVTEIREAVKGEVVYTTFDETPENQARVLELALERAMRLAEKKRDVVILLDSLSRMIRLYNLLSPQTARILSEGLAASALNKPKKFLGAARNTREGGSITVIAAVDDHSQRLDEAIAGEIRGVSNMEWVLEKQPTAANVVRGMNRRAEMLLTEAEQKAAATVREMLQGEHAEENLAQIMSALETTESNAEFAEKMDLG